MSQTPRGGPTIGQRLAAACRLPDWLKKSGPNGAAHSPAAPCQPLPAVLEPLAETLNVRLEAKSSTRVRRIQQEKNYFIVRLVD